MKIISQHDFIQKYGFLFFHIPKNAGTSFLHAIGETDCILGHHQTARVANYFYGKKELHKIFKFAILRNPISRFVSAYQYARMEKSYWHQAGTPTEHLDYQLLTSKTVDEAVFLLITNQLRDPWHWKPQSFFIKVKNTYLVDAFACQENLSQDINNIMVQIRKPPLEIPYVNRSNDIELALSEKSKETLLDFYYEDYILWKSYSL